MRWIPLAMACLMATASVDVQAQDDVARLRADVEQAKRALAALEVRLNALETGPGQRAATADTQVTTQTDATVTAATPEISAAASAPATAMASSSQVDISGRPAGVAPSILPPRESVADPSIAASRVDSAASPTDPELKGFIPIPGTSTLIRLGGYAKLDVIKDVDPTGNADQFAVSAIPITANRREESTFNIHAKQTRFSLEARRSTDFGNLRFYLENDFFGSKDGYQYRLRHAYGQIGNTYAGYGYSSFMDADALPDTLDFAGAGAASFVMLAGVHHSFDFGKGNSLTLAMEDPDTQLPAGSGQVATTRMPDVSLVGRMERDWGHLQAGTVLRRLSYAESGHKEGVSAYGVMLTGSTEVGERDLLLFGANWGEGIARYLSETGGANLDAAITADGSLQALGTYGAYFGYTHYWSNDWRSNLVYSDLRLDDEGLLAGNAFRRSRYGAANLIWSPAPSWLMGVELLYGKYQQQDGQEGDAVRVQGSLQYNFIK